MSKFTKLFHTKDKLFTKKYEFITLNRKFSDWG